MQRPFGLIFAFIFLAFLASCSGSGQKDASGQPGNQPAGSPVSRPPQDALPIASSTPVVGALAAVPEVGPCEPFRLEGRSFPAGADLAVYKWDGLDQLVEVAMAKSDDAGTFTTIIAPEVLGNCSAGSDHVFEVRLRAEISDLGPWPRAVYQVEPPGPLTVTPERAHCRDALRIHGEGFPPGAEVTLLMGDPDPMTHNYATIGEVRADADGAIGYTYVPPTGGTKCRFGIFDVNAVVYGKDGRWRTTFEYVP